MTNILLEAGTVSEAAIEQAVMRQRETGRRIGETLIEMGVVTEQDIAWALSRQLGITYVDVTPEALDRDLIYEFQESILRRLNVVPLVRDGHGLTVAMADPLDEDCQAELTREARATITVCVATTTAIHAALDRVFGSRVARPHGYETPIEAEGLYDILWERSGVTFLLFHVSSALKRGIAELHFLPGGGQLHVYYREGRRLVRVASEPAPVLDYLLTRLEALGLTPLGDQHHLRAQLRCPLHAGFAFLDVSLLRSSNGIAVTMSPRPEFDQPPSLDSIGLDSGEIEALRELLHAQAGLVLVCGPPGSGTSTTLAALVDSTDARHARVLAFEPKPAAPLPQATRVHVPTVDALAMWEETVIAQNADLVLLDEVLKGDHVMQTLSPAGSGRLMLATTDWTDSFALLSFLSSTPRARVVLADRMLAIIQQRALRASTPRADSASDGTPAPHTAVLFEVLTASDLLREAIRSNADPARLRQVAIDNGFRSLATRVRDRVANGTLSAIDAARVLT